MLKVFTCSILTETWYIHYTFRHTPMQVLCFSQMDYEHS